MANQVIPTELFESKFKRLKKKFLTLEQEMRELTEALEITPTIGISLGSGLYKIRLGSKGGGKNGSSFRLTTKSLWMPTTNTK